MKRLFATTALSLYLVGAGAAAWAAAPPTVMASPRAGERNTVAGPATIDVVLKDSTGKPVGDALVQLVMSVTFVGRVRDAVLDQQRTDWRGRATLTFAPAERGTFRTAVRFAGAPGYAPSEASVTFTVEEPVAGFRTEPVGLGGKWASSSLILLPLAGVWTTYGFVALLVTRMARAKGPAVRPEPVIDLGPMPHSAESGTLDAHALSPSLPNGHRREAERKPMARGGREGGRRR